MLLNSPVFCVAQAASPRAGSVRDQGIWAWCVTFPQPMPSLSRSTRLFGFKSPFLPSSFHSPPGRIGCIGWTERDRRPFLVSPVTIVCVSCPGDAIFKKARRQGRANLRVCVWFYVCGGSRTLPHHSRLVSFGTSAFFVFSC